jgi:hypothetical protein
VPGYEAAAEGLRAGVNGRGQALLPDAAARRHPGPTLPDTAQCGDAETSGPAETPRAGDVPGGSGRGSVSTDADGTLGFVSTETGEPEEWTPDEVTAELAKQIVAGWPAGQRITQRAFLVEFRARGGTVSNRDASLLHRFAISPAEPDEDDDQL